YSLAHRGALPRRSVMMIDDQPRAPLARQKGPNPLQEDAQAEAGCGQELEVDESPNHPREQAAHLDLPTLQYGEAPSHHGHGALVEVAKRSRLFAAGYTAVNKFSRIMSLLHSHLCDAGKGLAVLLKCRGIADHKSFGMSWDSQISLTAYPPGTVRLHVEPLARSRRRDTGGPDHGLARNALTR